MNYTIPMQVLQPLQNLLVDKSDFFWFQLLPLLEKLLQVRLAEFHDKPHFRPARVRLWYVAPADKLYNVVMTEPL